MLKADIRVLVETVFVPEQSDAESRRYVFAYTITLSHHAGPPALFPSFFVASLFCGQNFLWQVRRCGARAVCFAQDCAAAPAPHLLRIGTPLNPALTGSHAFWARDPWSADAPQRVPDTRGRTTL